MTKITTDKTVERWDRFELTLNGPQDGNPMMRTNSICMDLGNFPM